MNTPAPSRPGRGKGRREDDADAEVQAVEQRIAHELARLATPTEIGGQLLPPRACIRRHLAEHAAAGRTLDDHTLRPAFLPHLDLPRFRVATTAGTTKRLTATDVLRRATHHWNDDRPAENDLALKLWSAALSPPPALLHRSPGTLAHRPQRNPQPLYVRCRCGGGGGVA